MNVLKWISNLLIPPPRCSICPYQLMANTSLLVIQNPLRIDFDTSLCFINGICSVWILCLYIMYPEFGYLSTHPLFHLGLNFHSIWLPAIASIGILMKVSCITFLFCWKTIHGLPSSLKEERMVIKMGNGNDRTGLPIQIYCRLPLYSSILSQRAHWSFKSNQAFAGRISHFLGSLP